MDALLAAVAAAPPVRLNSRPKVVLHPGTLVDGTYRVERKLGSGGMGVVHLAQHIELGRQVALKLHRGEVDSHELGRLRREARVMARLDHGNVLAVHGVGTHEGRMFIAMEYAAGGTLREWLEVDHDWREIVTMMVSAGRGLAAAHRMGVVHRDFKPDNVLVGSDRQPRVADFGLARGIDDPALLATNDPEGSAPDDDIHRFTMTGSVVGTPAYMSPEQFDGIEVGPASDQFSYCVVLYEAVAGRRPFAGRSSLELAQAVHEGQIEPLPARVRLPAQLLEVLARGLRPVPGDRHASMEVLVAKLERLLGARRRRARWLVGGATIATALGVGAGVVVATTAQPCEQVDDALGDAWSEHRRAAVQHAWPGLEPAAAGRMLGALDGFAQEWTRHRREVCEATRVRDEQSEHAFGLRMACLDRAGARFDALTSTLAEGADAGLTPPDEGFVSDRLPALSPCDDVERLDTLSNRFAAQSARDSTERDQAYSEAGALLMRAVVRGRLGGQGVRVLAEQAAELGHEHELPLVESRALELVAEVEAQAGNTEAAAQLQQRAIQLALDGGSDEATADLAMGRAEVAMSADQGELAAAHLEYARAFISRVRDAPVAVGLEQRAQVIQANLSSMAGDDAAAVELLVPLADDPTVDSMLRLSALMRLGLAEKGLGHHDRALAAWTRLVLLITELRGPEDLQLTTPLVSMATVQISIGREREALAHLRRAQSIVTMALGEEDPKMIRILGKQGIAQRQLGQLSEARATQERSLALRLAVRGQGHASTAYPLDELGELARRRGDLDQALQHLTQALQIREQRYGVDSPRLAITLTRIGQVHLSAERPVQAEVVLRRALMLRSSDDVDPVKRARTELALADAILHSAPGEARDLTIAAHDRTEATGVLGESLHLDAKRRLHAMGSAPL